jgi:hypothetical protein
MRGNDASASFAPELMLMDLPVLSGSDETAWARAAGLSVPWRRIALSSSVESEGYAARATLIAPARSARWRPPCRRARSKDGFEGPDDRG